MGRDPGMSLTSDTRRFVQDELLGRGRGGGPSGWVVVALIVVIAAVVAYVVWR